MELSYGMCHPVHSPVESLLLHSTGRWLPPPCLLGLAGCGLRLLGGIAKLKNEGNVGLIKIETHRALGETSESAN